MKHQRDSFGNESPSKKHLSDNEVRTSSAIGEADLGIETSMGQGEFGDRDADDKIEVATESVDIASRAYQLEMLELSLQQNVIVAMDTGSGKTQIAVLRIRAELEKPENDKIIWFLAPTVLLCEQQLSTIKLQLPSVSMRILTGNDKVDTWDKSSWAIILEGTRLIVSTYQVLLDALDHAFVNMSQLSLIVFDEAHNCVGKHPGGKIMSHFYHKQDTDVTRSLCKPSILGLTATPSMKAQITGLEQLEALLDARCISPNIHREDLLRHVSRPQLYALSYEPPLAPWAHQTRTMESLRETYLRMDISKDPYILSLQENPTERNKRDLEKAITRGDTFSMNQIKGLLRRSFEILGQLGPWAADYYIWQAKEAFLKRVQSGSEFFDGWISDEKRFVAETLQGINAEQPSPKPVGLDSISDKVNLLLRELMSSKGPVLGIVFVKERATAAVLASLLSSFPQIQERFRVGAMVGTSSFASRRSSLYEFFDAKDLQTLFKFRLGEINLLVATAVLEEGIDVPACNLVICFDTPTTSKSFVQRRGRARMAESKLILFTESSEAVVDQWSELENAMMELCRDDERERYQLEVLEDSDENHMLSFIVKSTGARLDMDNAKQHLEHFCKVLSQGEFVDNRPDYIVEKKTDDTGTLLRARLILPSFLPVALRQAEGAYLWRSEKNATKDVAFQAYLALYNGGLVNDNLLPYKLEEIIKVETRAPIVDVDAIVQPWREVAQAWRNLEAVVQSEVGYYNPTGDLLRTYNLYIPAQIGELRPIKVHVDGKITHELRFSPPTTLTGAEGEELIDCTSTLLALHFGHRWKAEERQHVIKLSSSDPSLVIDNIGIHEFDLATAEERGKQYLVRDGSKAPYTFVEVLPAKPDLEMIRRPFKDYEAAPADEPYLHLGRWTRRTDFLHKVQGDTTTQAHQTKPYTCALPLSYVRTDAIHIDHACFGRLIPSIIHEIEVMLVARQLSTTVLQDLGLTDLALIRQAISARSAGEPMNYERLEFLGDSILKYCTAVQASADHLEWPEGYLSLFRDRLVANSRLSRAALETGLSKYILTVPFTGQKWRPLYVDDLFEAAIKTRTERTLSTKVLADVVESLIGASYTAGGTIKAVQCISIFVKDCTWRPVPESRSILYKDAPGDHILPPVLQPLEELLGYSFKKKALLVEACTHASFVADIGRRSMERLEFLGDAILDNVIVTKLFNHDPPLPHHAMHMIKTALVNKDFLAFVTLEEHELQESEAYIDESGTPASRAKTGALWKFMRHASIPIGLVQSTVSESHRALRDEILTAISEGTHYPWALLARLQAKKFYCDIFEALLGAVWIDSGSIDECKAVVARFGIMSFLERILRENVHVQHPKEELGKLALAETVNYKIGVKADEDGEKQYNCQVLVGDRLVAEVNGGVAKEEVKTKAATEAVRVLTMEANGSEDVQMTDE